jgi:methionine-rich copper-binding protein CopC
MAGAALAHPSLTSASPGANAVVTGSPGEIKMTFSEAPFPKFSGVTVTDAAGKKVALGPLAISPTDKKQLIVPVKASLKAGVYKVDWFAVAGDTHRVTGKYSFTVK